MKRLNAKANTKTKTVRFHKPVVSKILTAIYYYTDPEASSSDEDIIKDKIKDSSETSTFSESSISDKESTDASSSDSPLTKFLPGPPKSQKTIGLDDSGDDLPLNLLPIQVNMELGGRADNSKKGKATASTKLVKAMPINKPTPLARLNGGDEDDSEDEMPLGLRRVLPANLANIVSPPALKSAFSTTSSSKSPLTSPPLNANIMTGRGVRNLPKAMNSNLAATKGKKPLELSSNNRFPNKNDSDVDDDEDRPLHLLLNNSPTVQLSSSPPVVSPKRELADSLMVQIDEESKLVRNVTRWMEDTNQAMSPLPDSILPSSALEIPKPRRRKGRRTRGSTDASDRSSVYSFLAPDDLDGLKRFKDGSASVIKEPPLSLSPRSPDKDQKFVSSMMALKSPPIGKKTMLPSNTETRLVEQGEEEEEEEEEEGDLTPCTIFIEKGSETKHAHIMRVSAKTTAKAALQQLQKEGMLDRPQIWRIFEVIKQFSIERPLRDWEKLLSVQATWEGMPSNIFLLRRHSENIGLKPEFATMEVYPESFIMMRKKQRKWQKKFFFIDQGRLLYSNNEKKLNEQIFCHLSNHDVYTLTSESMNSQQDLVLETPFAFALRSQDSIRIFERPEQDYVHYLCAKSVEHLREWVVGLRIARNEAYFHMLPSKSDPDTAAATTTTTTTTTENAKLYEIAAVTQNLKRQKSLARPSTGGGNTGQPLISYIPQEPYGEIAEPRASQEDGKQAVFKKGTLLSGDVEPSIVSPPISAKEDDGGSNEQRAFTAGSLLATAMENTGSTGSAVDMKLKRSASSLRPKGSTSLINRL